MFQASLVLGLGAIHTVAMSQVIEAYEFAVEDSMEVLAVAPIMDDPSWRDRDGEGCWAYRNHLNGARFACTAPGYEDALWFCKETCGSFAPKVGRDDPSWRDRDGEGCWAYRNHLNGARFACTAPGYEDALWFCKETCGAYISPPTWGGSSPGVPVVQVEEPDWRWRDLLPRTCRDVSNCLLCVNAKPLNGDDCAWNEHAGVGGACTSTKECDYNETPVARAVYTSDQYAAAAKPTVSVCIANTLNCVLPSDGTIQANPDVGTGCTTHSQCSRGQYCFSCEQCHRAYGRFSQRCGLCDWDANASGDCGVRTLCKKKLSINGFCPRGFF